MKLSNFSGSAVHEWVLKIGHTFGHKFKPWEAIKWAKGVAIGGRILGALGVGFSVFMQIKSDQEENKARIELQRINLDDYEKNGRGRDMRDAACVAKK